jgi:hypothetical protein
MPKTTVPLLKRLLSRTEKTPSGCLLWTGACTPNGQATISVDGRSRGAHRVIWEILKGPIPEGLDLDHQCHNRDLTCDGGPTCPHRRCLNVDHMEPVTNAVNCKRGRAGINSRRKTHCPKGHEYTEENTWKHKGRRHCKECKRLQNLERRDYFRQRYQQKKRAAVS